MKTNNTATTTFATDFVIRNGELIKYVGPGGDVVIPDSVTEIGCGAFHSCASLTSVTIPDSVTVIGWAAFAYCNNLRRVRGLKRSMKIDPEAFYGSLWDIKKENSLFGLFIRR